MNDHERLELLKKHAGRLDGAELVGDYAVIRKQYPIIVRMTYERFLTADHDAVGGTLADFHLTDTTVLVAYAGRLTELPALPWEQPTRRALPLVLPGA